MGTIANITHETIVIYLRILPVASAAAMVGPFMESTKPFIMAN